MKNRANRSRRRRSDRSDEWQIRRMSIFEHNDDVGRPHYRPERRL